MKQYIINIIKYDEICECDFKNHRIKAIMKNNDVKLSKGLYSNILESNIKIAGIVESDKGPVIFFDNQTFLLPNTDFNFIQETMNLGKCKFELYINKKKVYELKYTKPLCNYDAWSAEEDVDIFQSILKFSASQEEKEKFIKMYTC